MGRRPAKPIQSESTRLLKERLEASQALAGVSIYRWPIEDREGLPNFCQQMLEQPEGHQCRAFHAELAERSCAQDDPLFETCPMGLQCFAVSVGEHQIGGGHIRTTNGRSPSGLSRRQQSLFLEVAPMPHQRLEDVVHATIRLIRPGFQDSPAPQIAELLQQRLPLGEFLGQMASLMEKTCRCDGVIIAYQENGDELRWSSSWGEPAELISPVKSLQPQARKTTNGTTSVLGPRKLKKCKVDGSWTPVAGLLTPFPAEPTAGCPGFLVTLWRRKRTFTPIEIERKTALASEILLGLRSARMEEESDRRAEEQQRNREEIQWSCAQTGTALASALNLKEILRLILELSIKLTRADGGCIYLIENREPSGRYRHKLGLTDAEPEYQTSLLVPLVRHERVKALLKLVCSGRRQFEADEVKLLEAFTAQAAMAIENAQIFEWEQEKAREATTLYQAARTIEEGQNLDEVLENSAEVLARVAGVNRCIILLQDSHRAFFSAVAAVGLSPDQQEFFSAFRLHVSQLSEDIRRTLNRSRPLMYESSPPEGCGIDRLCSLLPSSSCLVLPLQSKERLLGLIYLDDSRVAHHFTGSMVRRIMTLSLQVANAIHRTSLINQLQENLGPLKALYQVSTAITGTLSLPKVIRLIVDQAVALLEHSACACLVLDEIGESFRLETSRGLSEELLDPALQARMARPAVERKRAFSFYLDKSTGHDDIRGPLDRAGFGGLLSVPLIAKKKMVGVLNCFVTPEIRFRQQEIRLLRGFANQAAIAVENARLHGMIRFKMGELGTLFEVSKAVTSTLRLDRVLQEIVRHVREILRADACSLMLLEADRLIMKTAEGIDVERHNKPIPVGRGVAGLAAKTSRPMVLMDREDAPHKFPVSIRSEGLKTILSVPIETRGKTIGLVNVYYHDYTTHTPAQISLLTALGSQTAVAIENARLYADKERVTELLRNALIPREKLEFPGLTVGHRFIPSMDLSGDYYDLIPLGDKRCGLVIADVSGKGPDAAIQTVRAKHVVQSYATAGYSPSEILKMLNQQVDADELGENRQVTVFYAEADLESRTLRFACAGHETPIFWTDTTQPLELRADGILVGAIPQADFEEQCIDIPEGSWLLLYTDGITEARSPSGEFFGLRRVLDVIGEHVGNSAQRLVNRIYTRVRKFTRERITDDFSLMAVRF